MPKRKSSANDILNNITNLDITSPKTPVRENEVICPEAPIKKTRIRNIGQCNFGKIVRQLNFDHLSDDDNGPTTVLR